MRLGISTASFFNRVPTESVFDVLRQMRIDTAEVFLNTFSEYEKPYVEALVPRKSGVAIHSVHALGTQFEPELFNANARVRADAEQIFRKVCYAGFVLGAKYYTFHGPVRLKKLEYKFDYPKLCDRVNRLAEIAQGFGVRLSYENVHWTYASEPEYIREILERCPAVCATLDVKQALQGGGDPLKFLDVMGERLSTIHLCDVNRDNTPAMPGKGRFNFEKFFAELNRRRLHVNMLLEVYPRDYKDLTDLKACYDYLAGLIKAVK
jgi:sugar phosphate isomerase/epimerase